MAVARETGAHIVAVDAMQVYRGMDIGTAKPTADDQTAVPHHCLDLVNPDERFTVADFKSHGVAACEQISQAGADALFVAGTGLYLTAVIDDLQLPGEWPEVRAALQAEPDVDVLFARLQELERCVPRCRPNPTSMFSLRVCKNSTHVPLREWTSRIVGASSVHSRCASAAEDRSRRSARVPVHIRPAVRDRSASCGRGRHCRSASSGVCTR